MNTAAEIQSLVSLLLYGLSSIAYGLLWLKSSLLVRKTALITLSVAIVWNFYQLMYRWLTTNQPPFKTLYESLVLLAICIAIVYVIIEFVYKTRVLGLPTALGAFVTMLYAFLGQNKEAVNLPPALQSGWFIPHVVIYFFGYAALFIASAAALLYLIRPKPIQVHREDLVQGGMVDIEVLMDNAVRFGFALLTIGLLVGAVWAKEAWGDYWTWDPKETWSLVTWLIFAAYLHLRYIGQWRGRKLAFLVLVGFGAVMFTYLGMNMLPTADQSVHVYQ